MRKKSNKSFAVLGLGRFGMSIVQTLSEYDVSILACDVDDSCLQKVSNYATHLVQGDVSDEAVLKSLGIGNFDVVIIAMAGEFEASQIATMVALEEGAKYIIVKARNSRQKKILENMGVNEVVLPEYEIGVKVARKLVSSNLMDVLEESEHYTISEMKPMEEWIGKNLRQADVRRKHNITVLAVRQGDKINVPPSPDKEIDENDILLVLSEHKK